MKAFLLPGGILYVAVIGWWLMGRLEHFLDNGGISPYWDEAEGQTAKKETSSETGIPVSPDCCSKSDFNI